MRKCTIKSSGYKGNINKNITDQSDVSKVNEKSNKSRLLYILSFIDYSYAVLKHLRHGKCMVGHLNHAKKPNTGSISI